MLIMLSVNGFFVPLLKKRFQLPDMPLLILAVVAHALASLVMGLSVYPWMVFMGELTHNLSLIILIFFSKWRLLSIGTDWKNFMRVRLRVYVLDLIL